MDLRGLIADLPGKTGMVHTFERGKALHYSHASLHGEVNRVRQALLDWGVRPGMRVGIYAPNSLAWMIHDLALIDIDAISVQVARDNARLNHAGPLVEAVHAVGFAAPQFGLRGPFGLVLANILANPLRRLAKPMADHLAPSAEIILSGMLPHQANSVIAAYRDNGLALTRRLQIDGWTSLLMQRR